MKANERWQMSDQDKIYKISKISEQDLVSVDWSRASAHELKDVTSGLSVDKKAFIRFFWSEKSLFVEFSIEDEHIWGTYTKDDDPIWQQEAVEVFLSFGERVPKEYFELQFSPKDVKYDAWVKNPTGDRADNKFDVDVAWDFKNIEYKVETEGEGEPKSGRWSVRIKIPSNEIPNNAGGGLKQGDFLRGNFFRIDGYPEQNSFQALAVNLQSPPNFHTPEKFATFELV